jgi:predicted RNase H-like HicB family nuclease
MIWIGALPYDSNGFVSTRLVPERNLFLSNESRRHMTYKVLLIKSKEGFAIGCPALPGCWSQGKTREEALNNIREAIQLWLEVAEEDIRREAAQENEEVASELVTV